MDLKYRLRGLCPSVSSSPPPAALGQIRTTPDSGWSSFWAVSLGLLGRGCSFHSSAPFCWKGLMGGPPILGGPAGGSGGKGGLGLGARSGLSPPPSGGLVFSFDGRAGPSLPLRLGLGSGQLRRPPSRPAPVGPFISPRPPVDAFPPSLRPAPAGGLPQPIDGPPSPADGLVPLTDGHVPPAVELLSLAGGGLALVPEGTPPPLFLAGGGQVFVPGGLPSPLGLPPPLPDCPSFRADVHPSLDDDRPISALGSPAADRPSSATIGFGLPAPVAVDIGLGLPSSIVACCPPPERSTPATSPATPLSPASPPATAADGPPSPVDAGDGPPFLPWPALPDTPAPPGHALLPLSPAPPRLASFSPPAPHGLALLPDLPSAALPSAAPAPAPLPVAFLSGAPPPPLPESFGTIGHVRAPGAPSRSCARLRNRPPTTALGRAMHRKACLLEGRSRFGSSVRKWSRKKIQDKSRRCGVELSDANAAELRKCLRDGA